MSGIDRNADRNFNLADLPLVSVLLPVRNGMPWLGAALDSVLAQTLAAIEIIVLEDGSTDGTPKFLATISDPRLRIVPTGGVGIARALNIGLSVASGKYIARHDADDESLPTRFARQMAFLETNPEIDIVATAAEYIDSNGDIVSSAWVDTVRSQQDVALTAEEIGELMPLTCCITHGSIMARRDLLRAHRYDSTMVPAEDYDLWLRLLPQHRFAKLSDRLYRHRLHQGQSGAQRREEQTRKAILAKLQYIRRVCPDLPPLATLAIVGDTQGDRFYREIARSAGFQVIDDSDAWDVLAVTDFAAIDAQERALCAPVESRRSGSARQTRASSEIDRIGNCFVSRPRRASQRIA